MKHTRIHIHIYALIPYTCTGEYVQTHTQAPTHSFDGSDEADMGHLRPS